MSPPGASLPMGAWGALGKGSPAGGDQGPILLVDQGLQTSSVPPGRGGEPSGWQWASLQRQRVSLLGGGEQQRTHGVVSGTRHSSQRGRPSLEYPGCRFNVGKGASYRRLPLGPERLSDLSTSSRPRPTFHRFPSVMVAAVCPPRDRPVLARCRAESRGPCDDSQWLSRRWRGCVCVLAAGGGGKHRGVSHGHGTAGSLCCGCDGLTQPWAPSPPHVQRAEGARAGP